MRLPKKLFIGIIIGYVLCAGAVLFWIGRDTTLREESILAVETATQEIITEMEISEEPMPELGEKVENTETSLSEENVNISANSEGTLNEEVTSLTENSETKPSELDASESKEEISEQISDSSSEQGDAILRVIENCNIRSTPSSLESDNILRLAIAGEEYPTIRAEHTEKWNTILLSDGTKAYVSAWYTELLD